jgi:hypothetical protein
LAKRDIEMNIIEDDIQKFLEILDVENNSLNIDILKKIAYSTMFFKSIEVEDENKHYLKCLVQDILSILDSVSHKSQRYYYFILRSYIENFLRVLLKLQNDDSTGVMKLFSNVKKMINSHEEISDLYENLDNTYSECCLFVHSNVKSGDEVNEFLKMIVDRNDFADNDIVNNFLEEFNKLLEISIKIFLVCHIELVDNSFYRKRDVLRKIVSEENYIEFRKHLKLKVE